MRPILLATHGLSSNDVDAAQWGSLPAGYRGDVYPAPRMWETATGVFPRYPFPETVKQMCEGGY